MTDNLKAVRERERERERERMETADPTGEKRTSSSKIISNLPFIFPLSPQNVCQCFLKQHFFSWPIL